MTMGRVNITYESPMVSGGITLMPNTSIQSPIPIRADHRVKASTKNNRFNTTFVPWTIEIVYMCVCVCVSIESNLV